MPSDTSAYIPWNWGITPSNPSNYNCPSTQYILTTFAVVDVATSILALLAGHRIVIKKITCGLFGRDGSMWWTVLWIIQVALHFAANAAIAAFVTRSSDFQAAKKPPIAWLMLLYTTRPRMTWMLLTIFSTTGKGEERPAPSSKGHHLYIHGWWTAAAIQTIISEIVLQIISCTFHGWTAHFAASHGYYLNKYPGGFSQIADAKLMYAGSLLYLIFVAPSILGLGCCIWMVARGNLPGIFYFVVAMGLGTVSWIGSWLFWAGYTKLAGDLYCPPSLIGSGFIWSVFTLLGKCGHISPAFSILETTMSWVDCLRLSNRALIVLLESPTDLSTGVVTGTGFG